MSDPVTTSNDAGSGGGDRDSVMFAQLVIHLSNMAVMFMGKVANPESGKSVKDMEAAQLFIDQLEMLEARTKGNLSKEESAFLKQSLMTVRMAFVEAVEAPDAPAKPAEPARPAKPADAPPGAQSQPATDDESRVKFSKKY